MAKKQIAKKAKAIVEDKPKVEVGALEYKQPQESLIDLLIKELSEVKLQLTRIADAFEHSNRNS